MPINVPTHTVQAPTPGSPSAPVLPSSQALLDAVLNSLEFPDPITVDANGWPALFHAIARDDEQAVRVLLPHTPTLVKPTGYTAMMLAAAVASPAVLELLEPYSDLAALATVEGQRHNALDRAIHKRSWENAHWLVARMPIEDAWDALGRCPASWPLTMSTRPVDHDQELARCRTALIERGVTLERDALQQLLTARDEGVAAGPTPPELPTGVGRARL